MKIAIRVDASHHMGSGHVMRCLALAEGLSEKEDACFFICADLPGNLSQLILDRGFEVKVLNVEANDYCLQGRVNATLSDSAMKEDVAQSKRVLADAEADWVIIDHYLLDERWESEARVLVNGVLAIDDIANRKHDCDILLDQNYEDMQRYRSLVPKNCHLLLGPRYALLRPEYAEYRSKRHFISCHKEIKNIFVFFGGADQFDLTGKTLMALSHPGFADIQVHIVVGASYLYMAELEYNAQLRGNTHIHKPRVHLADLMVEASLAVGAGGVTNWERLTLGLPSLVITQADNQKPISQLLDKQGVIKLLGTADEATPELILSVLLDTSLVDSLLQKSQSAMMFCDGFGVHRVVSAITLFR